MARLRQLHPVLAARDVPTSARFYEGLGFRVVLVDPRYAVARRDAVELHLQWADEGQWREGLDRPCLRIAVDDVDALFSDWEARGAPVGREGPWARPKDTPWGTREFHLRDPGGTVLQLYADLGPRDEEG